MNDDLQTRLARGQALQEQGKLAEAANIYAEALQHHPGNFHALNALSVALLQSGDMHRGAALVNQAVAAPSAPDDAMAMAKRGKLLLMLGRPQDALASCDRAIALAPDLAEAHSNRGNVLAATGRGADALASYDHAIALKADYAEAYGNRGNVLVEMGRPEAALESYDKAVALKPQLVGLHFNRGLVLQDLKRFKDATVSYDRVLAAQPGYAEAHVARAGALIGLQQAEAALEACDRALTLKPDLAQAWRNRATALNMLKRHAEAAAAYSKLLALEPEHPFAKGELLHQKTMACEWGGLTELIAAIERDIEAGKQSATPFGWQGVAQSPRSLQLCARIYGAARFPARAATSQPAPAQSDRKIRIGYVSGDFRDQAVSQLCVGMWEHHDRNRFEIFAFDNGGGDNSETRRRIEAAMTVVPIRDLDDTQAAAAITQRGIDILVNLNGYFGEDRNAVFARRPAPIQVNYLGFPGTLGLDYIDYIVADAHVIPDEDRRFYTEKVVHLPECYLANDGGRPEITRTISRAQCGLAEDAIVFCCFNNHYKILPAMFDIWMRVLQQVEGSVLWLLEDNAAVSANLRKEAAARGIAPERLIFAPRMPLLDHVARHRCADLFLDTLPYNAHTTASDALWAGLPVLTTPGNTLVGRVAASMLEAMRLPELISASLADYERQAIALGRDLDRLAALKRKVTENRLTTPLFDSRAFARRMDAAYTAMQNRRQAGLPPDHIVVTGA